MNPPDEFLKHAADCEQMAKFARDPESKATWSRSGTPRCRQSDARMPPLIGPITKAQ
jgi:hypothetical protein